ncbi:hypothetical protein RCO48_06705 [Peribacillus frigoritolerans]|nr:hypothetical protein [Peribacillus frigoritolerans]
MIGAGVRDSCGKYVSKGDPAGARAPRRLPDRPRKASSWSGDQIVYSFRRPVRQAAFLHWYLKAFPHQAFNTHLHSIPSPKKP